MNYDKLINLKPTEYGKMTNSLNQEITFYEHPHYGEDSFVIAVCHELKLASNTEFFELDDMIAEHKEYEPLFINGKFQHGL